MPEPRVTELTTDDELAAAVSVLRQLWTDADESTVRSWCEDDEYHLLGRLADGEPVAVAGVSVQRVLHHARHAWVHDFVVDEAHREEGHGAALLDGVDAWARNRDCEYLALAVREGNDDALGFYDAAGLDQWGRVMERPLE